MSTVDRKLGAIARPGAVHFVTLLPKTRSGKLLRRAIQALAEGRDPGDLTTIEDPAALEQIRGALDCVVSRPIPLPSNGSLSARHTYDGFRRPFHTSRATPPPAARSRSRE